MGDGVAFRAGLMFEVEVFDSFYAPETGGADADGCPGGFSRGHFSC